MADDTWSVGSPTGRVESRGDLVDAYLDHVRRLLPDAGRLAGARVALDMAHGATTSTAEKMVRSLGLDVIALGNRPNGRNINLECGSTHPARLAAATVAGGCRLGAAFDGDGDRVILVDARGRVIDGDAVLLMLALSLQRTGQLAGDTVVATVMSNIGLELALRKHGIRLIRTPVGDKYVMEEMLRGGYVLGGEQSGHVILSEHLPTGDGLATLLAVLRVMRDSGRELDELAAELVTYPQTLVNVRVKTKTPVDDVKEIRDAIARVEAALDGRGRVLVRYSGTEPLLRIMIEGEDQASVQMWAEEIAEATRLTLG
jgi:phosphoglucosamine mutase